MQLYHRQYGDEGSPLVVLHGLLGASGNWHTLAANAFAPHFRVFALDQRNHGRSPHSETFDYPSMAGDVRDFLDRQGLDTAHILGHSMGSKTAMFFAAAHPERVDRLVVADMAPKAYAPAHRPILEALRSLDLERYAARGEIDAALAEHIPETPVRQFLLKNLDLHGATGRYGWKMNLDVLHRDYENVLVGLDDDAVYRGPALFVRGGASDYVTDADVPRIRRQFPRAEVVTLDGAGHWLHAEAPQAFAEAVLAFLR